MSGRRGGRSSKPATAARVVPESPTREPWAPIEVAGEVVGIGTRRDLEIPVARLPTQTFVSLPVAVVHGARPGVTMWISGGVHGDELNGIEIVRRVLETVDAESLRGTLLAVPIVNVFGFLEGSRYLPDRRDLNRSFPGSARGSLASRLAALFLRVIVGRCTHGIDLHTATDSRTNLPQIRADLEVPETLRIAKAFGAPVMLHSRVRDGSLRQAARQQGIHTLLFEGGQALRFDEHAISAGVDGVLRVMSTLRMLPRGVAPPRRASKRVSSSTWLRSPRSGILRMSVKTGDRLKHRQPIGDISDLFGSDRLTVTSPAAGIVIGRTLAASVHRGDAILHVAQTGSSQ